MEHELEHRLRLGLVVDERLPLARGAAVARDREVGLQAELAGDRGRDLTLVVAGAGEGRAVQEDLDEELRVPDLWSRVEGRTGDSRVDVISRSDGVRDEKPHSQDFVELALGCVGEAGEDLVGRVERLGDETVGGGLSSIHAADEGGELGSTRAVGGTDGSGELNAVATS